jgi:hypothetical protein
VRRLAASTLDQREAMIHAIETSSVVPKSELTASKSRIPGTPPPIPYGKTHPYAQVSEAAPSVTVSTADEDSTSYASIEVDQPQDPMSANAPAARRRLSRRALAVTAAVGMVALALVFVFRGRSPANVRGMVSDRASTALPVSGPALVRRLPLAAPDPGPPVLDPTLGGNPAKSPKSQAMDKAASRRTLLPPRPQARATNHAKHYLPSKL